MNNNTLLYFLHCMTPVHVGAGQGVGAIDMPMIREKVTQWPLFPGSSMKGVHRDYFRAKQKLDSSQEKTKSSWVDIAFGDSEDQGLAGAIVMSDARILAFPVTSQYGTFAYATCPMVLKRLHRDIQAANGENSLLDKLIDVTLEDNQAWICKGSKLVDVSKSDSKADSKEKKLQLDEFTIDATISSDLTDWTKNISKQLFKDNDNAQTMLVERMVLISDAAFQYFVTMCSEIVARIRISAETKTVERGALWNEEYLPTEALLYGMIWIDEHLSKNPQLGDVGLSQVFEEKAFLQIGGNTTVGKGRVRCSYVRGEGQ